MVTVKKLKNLKNVNILRDQLSTICKRRGLLCQIGNKIQTIMLFPVGALFKF